MSTKKPKKIYRYVGDILGVHKLTAQCCPKVEITYHEVGELWRCTHYHPYADYYGFERRKDALKEYMKLLRFEIFEKTKILKVLEERLK